MWGDEVAVVEEGTSLGDDEKGEDGPAGMLVAVRK